VGFANDRPEARDIMSLVVTCLPSRGAEGKTVAFLEPRVPMRVMFHMSDDFSRPAKSPTPEEKKARDAARRADAAQAMLEYEKAQKAFHQNRERLRAERLAREAALMGEKCLK
jgi:hypothetical protein